ncbi:MAG: DUF479 domain-containing protein [Zoogloeaceae bacterium]|nr:DUF479 domain-containing protein [Rhodocyclaceae bacterium]MCP5235592.1 DUF479 domain-containing protein [Zoogloeaceae bacterium]
MNFLAHAWLAGEHSARRVGGLAGDFVKGPLPAGLPPDLAAGVGLHRAIDSFSERHPAFVASRARVGASRRRYAGVLVDMFYDHLLAIHWARFSGQTLVAFSADTYRMTEARLPDLPAGFGEVFERMRSGDWLSAYREPQALADALARMSRHRIRRANPLADGFDEFQAASAGFETDFLQFMPDALAFARQWQPPGGRRA